MCVGRIKHCLSLLKAGHVCGDSLDLVEGQPTGSVRVSFGYMSTFEDCQKFLNFVSECFVEKPVTVDQVRLEKHKAATAASYGVDEDIPIRITNGEICKVDGKEKSTEALRGFGHRDSNSQGGAYTLTNIYIYPIKSCGAFEVRTKHFCLFKICFCPLLSYFFLLRLCAVSSCRSKTGR